MVRPKKGDWLRRAPGKGDRHRRWSTEAQHLSSISAVEPVPFSRLPFTEVFKTSEVFTEVRLRYTVRLEGLTYGLFTAPVSGNHADHQGR